MSSQVVMKRSRLAQTIYLPLTDEVRQSRKEWAEVAERVLSEMHVREGSPWEREPRMSLANNRPNRFHQPHCLVADIYPVLEQQILGVSQDQREANVHHHDEADHLGRGIEIAEWTW